jgi:Transposase DDE domain
MILHLPRHSLILADLGYFCFEWFDDLTTQGYFWISRLQGRVTSVVVHTYYQRGTVRDALIYLGTHRFNKAGQLVRLIEFDHAGKHYRYLTNVLDPQVLPAAEVARLYARRWDIELALAVLKEHLHLQGFATGKVVLVQQQLWSVVLLAQILHVLQLEIAAAAGVDPFAVSLPLLVKYYPLFAHQPQQVVVALLADRGKQAGIIRPHSRTKVVVPPIDLAAYEPAPPEVLQPRTARYARTRGPSYHTAKQALSAAGQDAGHFP